MAYVLGLPLWLSSKESTCSAGVAGLSSRDADLLEPTEWPQGSQAFSSPPALHPSQHQGLFQWVRWPKYWRFSFNISPSNEHPGLISFGMDWLDLLAVQGTLKSLLQGAVLGWRRNRMGRPLSPPQIHQKNIWTLSKFHKTTSECRQRTSGTQKCRPLSSKGGRKRYKRKKVRQKR